MIPSPDTASPLCIAGLGVPVIDFITPGKEEFEAGRQLIAELKEIKSTLKGLSKIDQGCLNDTISKGPEEIAAAKEALAAFTAFVQDKNPIPGAKPDLDQDEADRVAVWFETMLVAARAIKRAAEFLGRPEEGLHIRHIGGTTTNKFHAIQSGFGDHVQTHLFGATGIEDDSKNLHRLWTEVKTNSKINFSIFDDLSLGKMPVNYIIQHGGDRVAFKAPIGNLARKIADDAAGLHPEKSAQINDFLFKTKPDVFFIEGSDLSQKKFGPHAFDLFANAAMDAGATRGTATVLAMPTDTQLVLGEGELQKETRKHLDALIKDPSTSMLTMNESEAVAYFCNSTIPKGEENIPENALFKRALEEIQVRLKQKSPHAHANRPSFEPIALVSAGKIGAYCVSADRCVFVPGNKPVRVVNSLGAGDAFAAGSFIEYTRILGETKTRDTNEHGYLRFTEDEFNAIVRRGHLLGMRAVEQKGAQVPPGDIAALVHGKAPTHGTFEQRGVDVNEEISRGGV